jgi:hypothetical protein
MWRGLMVRSTIAVSANTAPSSSAQSSQPRSRGRIDGERSVDGAVARGEHRTQNSRIGQNWVPMIGRVRLAQLTMTVASARVAAIEYDEIGLLGEIVLQVTRRPQ